MTAKLIATNGPYEIYRAGSRMIILRDGEFDHQQFKGHRAFRNPEDYLAHIVALEQEAAAEAADRRADSLAAAAEYLAARADRAAAQLSFF